MGHSTGCVNFQYIHGRESYEVLLAILKKRKKVTFTGCSNNLSKRPRLHSPKVNEQINEATEEEVPEVENVPEAGNIQPNLSLEPTESLSMLADVALATSVTSQPDTQPNDPPKSPPDLVTESVDEADHPCEEEVDEEMPPLEYADA